MNSWFEPLPRAIRFTGEVPVQSETNSVDVETVPYSTVQTLRPRYWYPVYKSAENRSAPAGDDLPVRILGPGFGISTGGSDLVGRHAYGLGASLRNTGQTDLAATYRYSGFANPFFSVGVYQNHRSYGFLQDDLMGNADTSLRPM